MYSKTAQKHSIAIAELLEEKGYTRIKIEKNRATNYLLQVECVPLIEFNNLYNRENEFKAIKANCLTINGLLYVSPDLFRVFAYQKFTVPRQCIGILKKTLE